VATHRAARAAPALRRVLEGCSGVGATPGRGSVRRWCARGTPRGEDRLDVGDARDGGTAPHRG
jgi:hypothetical protein